MSPKVPWDWVGAFALVALVELVLSRFDAQRRLSHDDEWKTLARVRSYEVTAQSNPGAQVVMLGSSTMRRIEPGLVAKALAPKGGVQAIDASFPGATTAAVGFAVDHLVVQDLRPKVLVYGIDTQSVNEHGARRAIQDQLIRNLQLLADSRPRFDVVWWAHEHLVLFKRQFLLREWLVRPWRIRLLPPSPEDDERAGDWTFARSRAALEVERDLEFGPRAVQEITAIAEAAKRTGALLVLVNMPFSKEYEGLWADPARAYGGYLSEAKRLAASLGVPLIDLHDGSYGHQDFSDSCHLAGEGARRAAATLGARLREVLAERGVGF